MVYISENPGIFVDILAVLHLASEMCMCVFRRVVFVYIYIYVFFELVNSIDYGIFEAFVCLLCTLHGFLQIYII